MVAGDLRFEPVREPHGETVVLDLAQRYVCRHAVTIWGTGDGRAAIDTCAAPRAPRALRGRRGFPELSVAPSTRRGAVRELTADDGAWVIVTDAPDDGGPAGSIPAPVSVEAPDEARRSRVLAARGGAVACGARSRRSSPLTLDRGVA